MMRPPPGGTLPHNAHLSWPQNERICIAWRGIIGGIGPSGATAAGGGCAAGGGAAPGGGGAAPASGGAPPSPPPPASALWHAGDSAAALTCRHRSATGPLGLTPGQCSANSDRHAGGTAATGRGPGLPASVGPGPGGASAGGGGPACAGSAGAGWGAAAAGSGVLAGGAAAGSGCAAAGACFGPTASSADLHGSDTLAALRLRHCSASRPPGCTPAQCDMKSERQDWRIAAICSGVGCWAEASSNQPPGTAPAKMRSAKTPQCRIVTAILPLSFAPRRPALVDPACVVLPYCICFATAS
jgi:hypothetical protein